MRICGFGWVGHPKRRACLRTTLGRVTTRSAPDPSVPDPAELGAVEAERHPFPGARRPDRRRTVDASGVALAVCEWGDPHAPPVLVAHGGFDFAETLNVFAPLLADGGWRVVSWDQRGHGDSAWTELYSWEADTRDGAAVLRTLGDRPVPIVGHSKGGALMLQLAAMAPHRVSHVVNLDGLPSRRNMPDVAEHERSRMLSGAATEWLDYRAKVSDRQRPPGTIEELAQRRGRMNERLSTEWLRYLVTVGARRDDDGWRWKIDPTLRMGGFGPWRPEWSMNRVPSIGVPFMGILGLELEMMGWGTLPSDVEPFLPLGARFVPLEGVGHFVHIEQPRLVADLVLEFLS